MGSDDDKKTPCPAGDELLAGPDLGDGTRPFIRHTADHKIIAGVMKQAPDGVPLHSGVFHLDRIEGDRYKVEDLSAAVVTTKGPAKVNSREYRNNWDGIFGKKQTVGDA
jgi:hypothetical protein